MLVDLPLPELRSFRYERDEPQGFDEFWRKLLAEHADRPVDVRSDPAAAVISTLDVSDLTFAGYGGDAVRAWYLRPAGVTAELPTVVEFIGYGGGRGLAHESLLWASCGYAHVVVDTRGQGAVWNVGATPDPHGSGPSAPGFLTRGLDSPASHYYSRVFVDAVRAVAVAKHLPGVDPDRVITAGGSQGGAIALAAASLSGDVAGVAARVPFLCAIERGAAITDRDPYYELTRWLGVHHTEAQRALDTLAHIDVVFHGRRATCPAYISAALMDDVCPPSTVVAAANDFGGTVDLRIWEWNAHEGGGAQEQLEVVHWADRVIGPGHGRAR
jgi:cephalosporin-C deacetylase